MEKFTESQPKDGDVILHCAHATEAEHGHWFRLGNIKFARPDGSQAETEWLLLCDDCFREYETWDEGEKIGVDALLRFVAGDSTWIGDEPSIEENPDRPEGTKIE